MTRSKTLVECGEELHAAWLELIAPLLRLAERIVRWLSARMGGHA